jgi:hypothetical protein
VDWQAVAVNGTEVTVDYYLNDPGCSLRLDRVEVDDNPSVVTLRFVVLYAGDAGATCPTSIATRTAVVHLPTPVGDRSLSGCHPDGFFLVPAGGYDNPAPRGDANGCMKP